MMPWSGLLPINVEHAYEMGTSELHLNQDHVGSHRADHGPKHAPGMIADEGGDNRKTAEKHNTVKTAIMRTDAPVEKRLTGTSPLPKTYTYQNRLTQRSYIAQVATNSRNTLLASAVSDGGQFNGHFGGGTFVRLGVYSAPTGTFSYAGTYAGIFAPGPASSDLPVGLTANTPYRVQGDALINASFVNNKVEGGVANRWLLEPDGTKVDVNADGVVDSDDQILVDITFPSMTITANGQFLGDVQVSEAPAPVVGPVIGSVNGVFGGAGATDVAGAIAITPLPNTSEHGVFNLPRCGLAGESPLCNPNPTP